LSACARARARARISIEQKMAVGVDLLTARAARACLPATAAYRRRRKINSINLFFCRAG
jgi:hypothetical protein